MEFFEVIYNGYYKKLFSVAIKLTGNRDCAHDIVHDVFESFYNKLNNGYMISYPASWLYKAVTNKCIDYSKHNRKMLKMDSINYEKTDEQEDEPDLKIVAINKALTILKLQEKALVVLYSEGLSYKEIANITGIKFASIGKMLSRTLEKLEHELKKQKYEMF